MDDFNKRRALINIFVTRSIFTMTISTIIINPNNKPLSIDNIPLDEIEGEKKEMEGRL